MRSVAAHLVGEFIFALAQIDDMPQQPIGRPFDKTDLDDRSRLSSSGSTGEQQSGAPDASSGDGMIIPKPG
jgi:hypothetical protein